ncbi:ribulose-phosphate 3-epimerase [Candidatus Woesearchaeota archaeon]|nr:ribulose-phosphate 3-epimerase [Candidatus Woesearchaeota archaeon]
MNYIIIPSIIATSQKELEERIRKVKNLSSWIQLDVMDGFFVKNHSLDFKFTLSQLKCKREAHLMMKNPEAWIEENAERVQTIIIHYEATRDIKKLIKLIKQKRKKAGIALNPETSIDKIKKYLRNIDLILIMTVHPGKYGSKFLPKTLKKVKELRKLRPKINIGVDGGINPSNIQKALNAGANRFVVGSYLVNSNGISKRMGTLKRSITNARN